MAREGTAAVRARTAPDPDAGRQARVAQATSTSPGGGTPRRRRSAEFQRDQCTDLAAALTYYSVLSVFPAILALVSLLGSSGRARRPPTTLLDIVRQLGQSQVADQLEGADRPDGGRPGRRARAGPRARRPPSGRRRATSGAFGRAMNRIYQVDEGRPVWKLRPVVLLITVGLVAHGGARADRAGRQRPGRAGHGRRGGPGRPGLRRSSPSSSGRSCSASSSSWSRCSTTRRPTCGSRSSAGSRWAPPWPSWHLGARVGRLRLLRVATSARTTRPYGSLAGDHRVPAVAVDHQPRAARSGPRSTPSSSGRASCSPASGRAHPAAAAARHPQLRQGARRSSTERVAEGRRLRLEAGRRRGIGDGANGYVDGRGDGRRGTSHASASAYELEPLPSERARAGAERRVLRPPTAGSGSRVSAAAVTGSVGTYASACDTRERPVNRLHQGLVLGDRYSPRAAGSRPGAWATSGRPTTRCCRGRSP